MRCGSCGSTLDPSRGSAFCPHCGASLSAGLIPCGACGRMLDPDAAFCDGCATPVRAESIRTRSDSLDRLLLVGTAGGLIAAVAVVLFAWAFSLGFNEPPVPLQESLAVVQVPSTAEATPVPTTTPAPRPRPRTVNTEQVPAVEHAGPQSEVVPQPVGCPPETQENIEARYALKYQRIEQDAERQHGENEAYHSGRGSYMNKSRIEEDQRIEEERRWRHAALEAERQDAHARCDPMAIS